MGYSAEPLLCVQCRSAAAPHYGLDGYLQGWICDHCGHFDKATGRERLFKQGDGDAD